VTETMACVPVSWLRLERYALGELAERERAEIAGHLAGCARCRACADQIANDARGELPALPATAAATAPAPVLPFVPPRRRWRIDWRQALAATAVAAVILAVVVQVHEQPGGTGAGPRVVAVKGGDVAIELVRERDGSVAWEPTSFAARDRFKLLLTCPPPLQLHADLVVLQDDGPAFPSAPSVIACGNRIPVPSAFRITGSGAATICVALDPFAPPSREALAAGDTPAAGPHACLRLEHAE
jgi:anti-sigma factor RsiW